MEKRGHFVRGKRAGVDFQLVDRPVKRAAEVTAHEKLGVGRPVEGARFGRLGQIPFPLEDALAVAVDVERFVVELVPREHDVVPGAVARHRSDDVPVVNVAHIAAEGPLVNPVPDRAGPDAGRVLPRLREDHAPAGRDFAVKPDPGGDRSAFLAKVSFPREFQNRSVLLAELGRLPLQARDVGHAPFGERFFLARGLGRFRASVKREAENQLRRLVRGFRIGFQKGRVGDGRAVKTVLARVDEVETERQPRQIVRQKLLVFENLPPAVEVDLQLAKKVHVFFGPPLKKQSAGTSVWPLDFRPEREIFLPDLIRRERVVDQFQIFGPGAGQPRRVEHEAVFLQARVERQRELRRLRRDLDALSRVGRIRNVQRRVVGSDLGAVPRGRDPFPEH